MNGATAYVNASVLFGAGVSSLQSSITSEINNYIPDTSTDSGVIDGYKAIYGTTANTILTSPLGLIELVIGLSTDGAIQIGANLQHPFSHGQISINSSNPLDYPVINPNYLNHPADVEILREGVKLARQLGETQPIAGYMTEETWPGTDVQTDDEWDAWMRNNIFTEYHPSSSCAMLPLDQGGVVDANLRVYGLSNVRVADASVPPIAFSAHLMASTYGLAEQASTLIRAYYNAPTPTKNSTNSTSTHNNNSSSTTNNQASDTTPANLNSTSSGNGSASGSGSSDNVAASLHPYSLFTTAAALYVTSLFLL